MTQNKDNKETVQSEIKLIVAGGRDYTDYDTAKHQIYYVLRNEDISLITIISGSCHKGKLTFTRPDGTNVYGADGLGERYAHERGIKVQYHPANWKQYGLAAGPIRNEVMAYECTRALVFHDGKSKGTANMIKMCDKYTKQCDVVNH